MTELNRSAVFVTVHKGASTFIADDFSRFLTKTKYYDQRLPVGGLELRGKKLEQMSEWPERGMLAVRVYPGEFRDLLAGSPGFTQFVERSAVVFLQRDPRDAAVSLYFSKAFSHTTKVKNKERFLEDRKALQEMTALEGVKQFTARPTMGQFRLLHEQHAEHGGYMMRYEDLVTDPEESFRALGIYLDWNDDLTGQVIAEFKDSFKPPSGEDPFQHKRRITPGNWREVFDDELTETFDSQVGPLLRKNDYS